MKSRPINNRMTSPLASYKLTLFQTNHFSTEIREYAQVIGINPDTEPELMWVAREGVSAPWTVTTTRLEAMVCDAPKDFSILRVSIEFSCTTLKTQPIIVYNYLHLYTMNYLELSCNLGIQPWLINVFFYQQPTQTNKGHLLLQLFNRRFLMGTSV